MSSYVLSFCCLASTCAALNFNAPIIALKPDTPASDSLELWNRTAFMLLGPYWAQHNPAKRTVMLRELLSSGSIKDGLAHRVTRIFSEKIRRAQRAQETGVEVIPGCGKGEPCTAKSYYEAVLLQSGDDHEDDDQCCDILWAACLQEELSSCMTLHWNATRDLPLANLLMIASWHAGPTTNFASFVAVPTSGHMHAHSLLQKYGSGDHSQCPVKACKWCAENGYKKNHEAKLMEWTYKLAPPEMDKQMCFFGQYFPALSKKA